MLIHFCRNDKYGHHHSGCVMADCVLMVLSDGADSFGVPMTTVVPCHGERFNVAEPQDEVVAQINAALPEGVPGLVDFGDVAISAYNVVGIEKAVEKRIQLDGRRQPVSADVEYSIVNMQGDQSAMVDAEVAEVFKKIQAAL